MALLTPAAHERGRATANLANLLTDTLRTWDIAIGAVPALDLDHNSRIRGRTVRDVCLTVGTWPHGYALSDMVTAGLNNDLVAPPRSMIDTQVRLGNPDATLDDVGAAWQKSADDIARWRDSGDAEEQALLTVGGPLGPVPLATLVGASAFQIAVALRDIGVASADHRLSADDHNRLHRIAVHSLTDSAGAVCARSEQVHDADHLLMLNIVTPQIRVGFGAIKNAWRTALLPDPIPDAGPRINAEAEVMIDIAAGRRSPLTAAAKREITVGDASGLLAVARALSGAPDLPGGDGLRAALAAAQGASGLGSFVKNSLGRFRT